MEIQSQRVEQSIAIHDGLSFVDKQDVGAGNGNTPAYTITGPDNYVIGIDAGTPLAPEFRDANGDKLDGSTRITLQKCDKQGNPLGDAIAFNDLLSRFSYEDMRNDPDYFRRTKSTLMIDEHEIVKVFVDIPSGSNGLNAANSSLTIGDDTSDFGQPVEIVDHSDLNAQESQAVKAASQANGGR